MTTTYLPPRHKYGWKRDIPDIRDYKVTDFLSFLPVLGLPTTIDLTSSFPPAYDQGPLGSCTTNSIGAGVEFLLRKQGLKAFTPSRLFIYFQERLDQGDTAHDTGASIRESAKAVATYGAPPETDWPYDVAKFALPPPPSAYSDGLLTRITQYLSVAQDATQMKSCLALGYPIHVGFSVYDSFESQAVASSGIAPLPGPKEKLLGGHAVVVVGYDDARGVWICRNSWGTAWGMNGYFTMPYSYFTNANLSGDFWTLRQVSGSLPTPTPTPTPTPVPARKLVHQINVYDDNSVEIVN